MLATALLFSALQAAPDEAPVRLEVVVVPKSPKAGEKVEVNLIARNVSKRPVAVTTAVSDGGMCAVAGLKILLEGKELHMGGGETSNPVHQSVFDREVTSRRFRYLEPGAYSNVFWISFDAILQDDGLTRRTKADYGKPVPSAPLKPGTYQIRGYYSFDKRSASARTLPFETYEFTPSAKRLFDMAYSGTLHATGSFVVSP